MRGNSRRTDVGTDSGWWAERLSRVLPVSRVLKFVGGARVRWPDRKEWGDAWDPGSAVGDGDLVEHGGSGPGGSSDPADPGRGRRRARRARRHVRRHVRGWWSAQRAAGGVVEVVGVDGDVLDPL